MCSPSFAQKYADLDTFLRKLSSSRRIKQCCAQKYVHLDALSNDFRFAIKMTKTIYTTLGPKKKSAVKLPQSDAYQTFFNKSGRFQNLRTLTMSI